MLADAFAAIPTERLLLRGLSLEDAPAIFALHSDKEVQRYLSRERMETPRASRVFINKITEGVQQGRWLYWAICPKEHPDQLIGTICLWQFTDQQRKAEIGFDLLPDFQRRGFISEAVKAILSFASTHTKLRQIEALTQAENKASRGLLVAVGFTFSHYLQETEKFSAEKEVELCVYHKQL